MPVLVKESHLNNLVSALIESAPVMPDGDSVLFGVDDATHLIYEDPAPISHTFFLYRNQDRTEYGIVQMDRSDRVVQKQPMHKRFLEALVKATYFTTVDQ